MIFFKTHSLHIFNDNFTPLMIRQCLARWQSKGIVPSSLFDLRVLIPEIDELF